MYQGFLELDARTIGAHTRTPTYYRGAYKYAHINNDKNEPDGLLAVALVARAGGVWEGLGSCGPLGPNVHCPLQIPHSPGPAPANDELERAVGTMRV